jgi:flavin-dependent dehydrogenase
MKEKSEENKSAQNHSVNDVIISGAGPVGLFLACELALAKCSVMIVEKAKWRSFKQCRLLVCPGKDS